MPLDREKYKARRRRWYIRHREQVLGDSKKKNKSVRTEVREYIKRLRNETPCGDCGLQGMWWAKDFDHVRGEKKGEIGRMTENRSSILVIQAEIDKCEVVCSNCHRTRTCLRAGHINASDLAGNGTAPATNTTGDGRPGRPI